MFALIRRAPLPSALADDGAKKAEDAECDHDDHSTASCGDAGDLAHQSFTFSALASSVSVLLQNGIIKHARAISREDGLSAAGTECNRDRPK